MNIKHATSTTICDVGPSLVSRDFDADFGNAQWCCALTIRRLAHFVHPSSALCQTAGRYDRAPMSPVQLSFLESLPEGFEYRPDLVSPDQEADLVGHFGKLELHEYEFHGFLGKRRIISFGQHYDFPDDTLRSAGEIPDFLLPLRDLAADFARIAGLELPHALVTEYAPGAAIGWHRDRPAYKDVIGISFVSPCRFRLRRKQGSGWQRISKMLEPRSVYLLRGPARTQWQHSIPPVDQLRYSVTFRSLNTAAAC